MNVADVRFRNLDRLTLVVGAGVSHSRGVPLWGEMVRTLWRPVFNEEYGGTLANLVTQARAGLRRRGHSNEATRRLNLSLHPFEHQFALELIRAEVRREAAGARARRYIGDAVEPSADPGTIFLELVRKALYDNVDPLPRTEPGDTLSVVAKFVADDRERRIVRIISAGRPSVPRQTKGQVET